jgi:hypothetical protein
MIIPMITTPETTHTCASILSGACAGEVLPDGAAEDLIAESLGGEARYQR